MDNELLIRIYDVGLGDCIYIRIPDKNEHRHVLIDCGNIYGKKDLLHGALSDLRDNLLPSENDGLCRLDLLVVTHPHKDHIAAFDLNAVWFENLHISNIWLSVGMDPEHEQAETYNQLHSLAEKKLLDLSQVSLNPAFDGLVRELLGASGYQNKDALDLLREKLPDSNQLQKGESFLFVHDKSPQNKLDIFSDSTTKFRVIAPVKDIDGEYLGRADEEILTSLVNNAQGLADLHNEYSHGDSKDLADQWSDPINHPQNISNRDFRRLRSRMMNNALAFVLKEGELVNNTSVVLLLEWRGKRLLFTGDAQFRKRRYQKGKRNGSWNVMWHYHRDLLNQPVDFLKVGHHGSHNATPWVPEEGHEINDILDSLVPMDEKKTKVVVSTARYKASSYRTIPDKLLMMELGKRIEDVRDYNESVEYDTAEFEDYIVPADQAQPPRTDLEYQITNNPEQNYINVKIAP
ncbi:MAG: hypothetical protein KAH97_00305 [Anaerolineales bacterium]|nr:hypothetical protein [Anaerolineales bacterium]